MRYASYTVAALAALMLSGFGASAADMPIQPPIYKAVPKYVKAPLPPIRYKIGIEGGVFRKGGSETVATGLVGNQWVLGTQDVTRSWGMVGGKAGAYGPLDGPWIWAAQVRGATSVTKSNVMTGVISESSSLWKVGAEGGVGYRWGNLVTTGLLGAEYANMNYCQKYGTTSFPCGDVSKTRFTAGGQVEWFFRENMSWDVSYRHGFGDKPTNEIFTGINFYFSGL